MRYFMQGLLAVLILAIIGILLSNYVVGSYTVPGTGMAPGLSSGEHLLVNKIAYNFEEPQRGDVICYDSPAEGTTKVKRIIGIPGDYVEVKNKALYINGNKVDEPYARFRTDFILPATQVPLNTYFVMFDNRQIVTDTEYEVSRVNIMGRAWICAWPPDKWGSVENYALDTQINAAEALQ
jgi:signal peptidase I